MKSLSKIKSEVKYARTERKVLGGQKYHQETVNRYHRASRKHSKLTLKQHLG